MTRGRDRVLNKKTSSSSGPDHIYQVQILVSTSSMPVEASGHAITSSVRSEQALGIPNQSNAIRDGAPAHGNVIGETTFSQRNTIGEGESNSGLG
ncbi:hypothetical protein HAX54_010310 [Datura stramonium]|uniref:Uncharacterized protein n=1 Tax=Datura stramonium TaxID=4076 RepID=A0ABS8TIU5_DATST|nr:hypothetical protein [Datura stramonium]